MKTSLALIVRLRLLLMLHTNFSLNICSQCQCLVTSIYIFRLATLFIFKLAFMPIHTFTNTIERPWGNTCFIY